MVGEGRNAAKTLIVVFDGVCDNADIVAPVTHGFDRRPDGLRHKALLAVVRVRNNEVYPGCCRASRTYAQCQVVDAEVSYHFAIHEAHSGRAPIIVAMEDAPFAALFAKVVAPLLCYQVK